MRLTFKQRPEESERSSEDSNGGRESLLTSEDSMGKGPMMGAGLDGLLEEISKAAGAQWVKYQRKASGFHPEWDEQHLEGLGHKGEEIRLTLTDLSGCCRENWRKARSRENRRLSQSRGAVTVTWASVVRSGQILGIYFGGRTDRLCCWTRTSSQGRNNWNGEDLEVQFGGFRFGHVNTSEIFTRDLVKMFGRWPYLKLFTVLKL